LRIAYEYTVTFSVYVRNRTYARKMNAASRGRPESGAPAELADFRDETVALQKRYALPEWAS
jgi:hypothetical protein